MKKQIKIILFLIFVFAGLLFSLPVYAATLELSLEKDIVSSKDDVTILVTINSEDQEINTAQATIFFPVNLLEVTKIDNTNSIFSFWLKAPSYDNNKGTISFVGGSTSGFAGPSLKLMAISFRVKGSGAGKLGVSDGAITASDGTGSNVYTTAKGLDINIPTTADFEAVKVEQANRIATLGKELPTQLGLSVPFYPDPTKWNNRSAAFKASWNINSDTTEAGVALNNNPVFVPQASAEALTGSKVFPALADGIWYLHLRLRNNIGWSPTLHYKIALDSTPPATFKITSDSGFKTNEPRPTIQFATTDLTSGINNYVIRLDGAVLATTNLATYKFDPLLPGPHNLNVSAVDKAGNITSETETLEILPITYPVISYVSRSVIIDEGGINAGGTALPGVEVIIQIQNGQKQIVFEQIIPVDSNGNWNVAISKSLARGNYSLLATARDKNMASSFPVVSGSIVVKERPVLVLGNLEISQNWFFTILIVLLLFSFGMGYLTYHRWRGKLGGRVVIAERDVLNIFDSLEKDMEKLIKNQKEGRSNDGNAAEMEYILRSMKENIEKSRHYIVENIGEINN